MDTRPLDTGFSVDGVGLDALVEGCAAAHQRLLALCDGTDESWMSRASLLPAWSRGHVLAHLARNADSLSRILDAAGRGEVADQYPGGSAERESGIAEGAARAPEAIVADLRRAIWELEGRWARADAATWSGRGRLASGAVVDVPETVFRRWRETVVHTFDLDVGIGWSEWPATWVRVELARQKMAWTATRPMGLGALPAAALALDDRRRLAWLLGRDSPAGLPPGPGL